VSKAVDAAGSGTFEVASLDSVSDDVRSATRAIYEEAFPAHQREPFEDLVASCGDDGHVALVAVDGGQPIGLVSISSLDEVGFLFLEYFAVAADRRGGGIGQALWRATSQALDAPGSIVLEVEDPNEPGIDAAETMKRERRVRFWEKVGARVLPVTGYVVPKLGEDGVEPLMLMWISRSPGEPEPAGDALRDVVVALYESGYGLDADDPLVARALDGHVA
jgi:GNAT superfamily N-acetyltransferase